MGRRAVLHGTFTSFSKCFSVNFAWNNMILLTKRQSTCPAGIFVAKNALKVGGVHVIRMRM